MLAFGAIAVLLCAQVSLTVAVWSYVAPNAPSNWTALGYPTCGGSRQSPIDIVTSDATYDAELSSLDVTSYSTATGGDQVISLTNSGHSVTLSIHYNTATPTYTVKLGGGMTHDYVLDNVHFHWGPNDEHGSEHHLDGHAYPLEAHFVHYRQDLGSVANGKLYSDGLAVLGFFFSVSTTDNTNFDFITNSLVNVGHKDDTVTLTTSFTPMSLLPSSHDVFYRYEGSLTTPGCDESVVWTVFKDTMSISSHQLELFRGLFENVGTEPDVHLEENFRPVQSLNGRTVTTSYMATNNGAPTVSMPGATLVMMLLMTAVMWM